MKTQSSLGNEYERVYHAGKNIDRIVMGTVEKVNYRYNTVDVRLVDDNALLGSSHFSEGKFAARLPVQFSGTNADGKAFGQVNPVQVGTLVLIGFIRGNKMTPVVLGMYGRLEESYNLGRSPIDSVAGKNSEIEEYTDHQFTLYPNMTYDDVDGTGKRTVTFTGKSFVVIDGETSEDISGLTDSEVGTPYENLDTSYYYTGELIEPKNKKAPAILFKQQGEDSENTFLWFLEKDGTHRVSTMKNDEDWRSYFELGNNGDIRLRRQNDSKNPGLGSDSNEVLVDERGVTLRAGDKYITLDKENGLSGNASGLGGGKVEADISAIGKELDELGRTILSMSTTIEQGAEKIRLAAEKITEMDGIITNHNSELEVMAETIKTKVDELTVSGMITDSLDDVSKNLQAVAEQARESLDTLATLVDDSKITPLEKRTLASEWAMIKAEYPGYIEQAKVAELPSSQYTTAYETLEDYIAPILESMESTSEVDRVAFNQHFTNYFTAKNNLVYNIFNQLNEAIKEAAQQAIEAGTIANTAVGNARDAARDAEKANNVLTDMASDGVITPQEKPQLRNQYLEITSEWENVVEQGETYGVSVANYVSATEALIDYVNSLGLFSSMLDPTYVDGAKLTTLFTNYYREYSMVNLLIATEAKRLFDDFSGDLEYYNTQITETSKEIELLAESVVAIGKDVAVHEAKISVQSHKISMGVRASYFKREVNETLNHLNRNGRNLYVRDTLGNGRLDYSSGEVISPVNKDKVTTYIDVLQESPYTVSVKDNKDPVTIYVAWYDATKKYLSGDSVTITEPNGSHTYISPKLAKYSRMSVSEADSLRVQFEVGFEATQYKISPEDMVSDVTLAREEQANRQLIFDLADVKYATYMAETQADMNNLRLYASDYNLTPAEKAEIQQIWDRYQTEYTSTLADANEYGLNSTLLQGTYVALSEYLKKDVLILMEETSPTFPNVMSQTFESYLEARNQIYETIREYTQSALEAATRIVEEAVATAQEAEDMARKLAQDAEAVARNAELVRGLIAEAGEEHGYYVDLLNEISVDGLIDPEEKVYVQDAYEYIRDEQQELMIQAHVYGISTLDITNAYNYMEQNVNQVLAVEHIRDTTEVNPNSFMEYFMGYYTAKETLLGNILDGALGRYAELSEQADLAYKEALRKNEEMIIYQNAIRDSRTSMERIEKKIDELENRTYYAVGLTSTNGLVFKNNNVNTQLIAKLYHGSEDITDTVPQEGFVWRKIKDSGEPDTVWNNIHKGIGSTVTITHEDVKGRATFEVEIFTEE